MLVADIRIYPVKGMRGRSVGACLVEPWGLAGDRRYMVVDGGGCFITQRDLPGMAVVEADLVRGGVELSAPGAGRVAVAEPTADSRPVEASIFRDTVRALDVGDEVATWLSATLGRPCRLVHMADPAAARPVDPGFSAPGDRVSFADGFPLLATTTASLRDLNGRLAHPVGMDRFRTNLAVEGAEAWSEDGWAAVTIGEVPFSAAKDCGRCAVPTVDQDTGTKSGDNEPLRTLSTFRRRGRGAIVFGQNLIPRGLGRIAVGDAVVVEASRAAP